MKLINEGIFLIILLLANTVQIITGFAGNLLAMPLSIALIGYNDAKVIINVFTLTVCLIIVIKNYQKIVFKELVKMLLGLILGMSVSALVFKEIDLIVCKYVYGIMITLIGINKLLIKRDISLNYFSKLLIIFLSGVIHELFLSGGALLVIYATETIVDKDQFRVTLAAIWIVLDSLLIVQHWQLGLYHQNILILLLLTLLPLIISVLLGNYLSGRVNQEQFKRLTYLLIIISGISMFIL